MKKVALYFSIHFGSPNIHEGGTGALTSIQDNIEHQK